MNDPDTCPHCHQPMPFAKPRWGQNAEDAETQVYGALRARFYEAWREHHPKEEPRPMGPEAGHARTVARWLLADAKGDIAEARDKARVLACNMFRDDMTTRDGIPWRWVSVAKDPGRFFRHAKNPARERSDARQTEAFERSLAAAEADAAPPEVGRAALAALKGLA